MQAQFSLGRWFKKSLLEGIAILIAAGCLALVFNFLRDNPYPLFPDAAPPAVQDGGASDAAAYGFYEISFEDALQHFHENSAVFVDARSPEAYRQGHIPGAVNLPDPQFDDFFGSFFEQIDPATFLITYCEGEHCPLSGSLAQKLRDAGYEKVYVLNNGWGQWKQRELPVERAD